MDYCKNFNSNHIPTNPSLLRICLLLILFMGTTYMIRAKNSNFHYYKQLGIKEGLSQSKVMSILSDYRGYLWIGTEAGLNRYDNGHLKQYLHQPNEKNSLPSNYINFIAEDSLSNLWVATMEGVCLYDRRNDKFQQIAINGYQNPFLASYLLIDDGIIFGGENCIYKFEYTTRQWRILYSEKQPEVYKSFRKMIRYDNRHVLINTSWHGIYLFDLHTNQLKKIDSFKDTNYTCIYMDSSDRLWVGPYGDGLYCYKDNRLIKHYTTKNSPLTYDVIYDITEKDNQLWIATDGGGVNILSLEDFSFSCINYAQDDLNSFPANAVCRIYCDPANNIWAGTVCHGLIGIKHVYANSYSKVPFNNPYGLSVSTVNSFLEDNNGLVWIGVDGGGINCYNPTTNSFKHYPTTKNDKITSIVEFSPRELLLFSFNNGFFLFDKANGRVRSFDQVYKNINKEIYIFGITARMQKISESKIVISTKHIYVYDILENKLEKIAENEKDYHKFSPLIISSETDKIYFLDQKNICRYDFLTKNFETIYHGNQLLNDAYMDDNGIFWLASENGLICYDPISRESQMIHTSLFNEITSVMADNQNRIWIGTRQSLYVYSTIEKNIIILDETDGIAPNEYISGSHLLLQNGDIIMGGFNGINYIDSNIRFGTETGHKIELLDVLLNGQSVMSKNEHESTASTVKIPWNFTSLQLKVLLNVKDVFHKNIFQFNIEGIDREFPYSRSNSLFLNYLPVGEYTIMASYYARNGEWSHKQKILHVIVYPPWWQTFWFYLCLCILSGLLIYSTVYYLLRKKRIKQKREIMLLKNKMYEEKINFLTNISHELRTPLTLICAPLKRIIDKETDKKDIDKLIVPIYKQAYQMKNIIDMVLDVRKLEEGKEVLHILPHSLNEWICSVGDKFAHEFEIKGIKLQYELDEHIKKVSFDKHKCEFVLSNFLMNALKFSEPDTVTTISSHLSEEGDRVRVSVKDEGMGLNLVDTESLFSNFYQGIHEKGGSGIGLSYAKSLITLHKGKIGALNATDKGAVFYFELPLSTVTNESPGTILTKDTIENEDRKADNINYTYLKKFSVIVVEDTVDLRNYLKETLKHYFERVYVAKDGKDGLEQIKQRLPDIIISDVMMPRMNGFELCRQVKTDLDISHIPFILLTAYHNTQNMYTGYKTGADAFLPKPFEMDGLLALCHNQLKMREQIRSRYKEDNLLTYKEVSFSNADETFLLKLDNLISDNMSNPELDVVFLATNMCISRSLLFNKVKAITGMGIIDYVNKQRIDKSVVLMNTTSMNMTEISEIVGFSSLRYFSRVFKSIIGETPSNYKKQNK